jgi:hypothetical protein
MSKRTLTVSLLTAGLTAGILATAVGPAAAQGNPVGGSGSYFFLSGAGSTGGQAQKIITFGNPNDETYFGDWDNSGTDSPMVRRGGTFYVSDDNGQLQGSFNYGNPGDAVLIGDWNGDGTDSIAVRRGNLFLVKNDNKKSGTADTEFNYGDPGDTVLVGDWDGNGTDTLAVQRQSVFMVKNDTKTGTEDFRFVFGDPGDKVIVGDWADPANKTSGNGADQLAVQRANHFFLSADLGADGKGGSTTLRDFHYGDAGDQVFVASLETPMKDENGKPVVNTKRAATYSSDVSASYKGGEPFLIISNGTVVQKKDENGAWVTHKAGDPKVHLANDKQLYLGSEPVLGFDGQPLKYTAYDSNKRRATEIDPNVQYERYTQGTQVLDADGLPLYYVDPSTHAVTAVTWTTDTSGAYNKNTNRALSQLSDAERYITPKAGDPILHQRGEQVRKDLNEQLKYSGGEPVVLHQKDDLVLTDGAPKVIVDGAAANPSVGTLTAGSPAGLSAPTAPSFTVAAKAGPEVTFTPAATGATSYSFNFGDGTPAVDTTSAAVDHAFPANGDYTVVMTAKNATGSITSTGLVTVKEYKYQTYADLTHDAGDGTVYQAKSGGTTFIASQAAQHAAGDLKVRFAGELATGWKKNGTTSITWTAYTLDSDEATNVYTLPGDGFGNNASKKVSELDDNQVANPVFYKGGEAVTPLNSTTVGQQPATPAPVDNYQGGEAAVAHKAGDVILDKDGNVTYTGDDKALVISGDGLGVRRNF